MSSRFMIGCVVATMALAAPAFASQHGKDSQDQQDKKICRTETVIGSIIRKSVCHSRAEWAQIDGDNGANAQTTLEKARQTYNPPQQR